MVIREICTISHISISDVLIIYIQSTSLKLLILAKWFDTLYFLDKLALVIIIVLLRLHLQHLLLLFRHEKPQTVENGLRGCLCELHLAQCHVFIFTEVEDSIEHYHNKCHDKCTPESEDNRDDLARQR